MLKTLIHSLIMASLLITASAHAKTFKIATLSPDGSAWMVIMKNAADEIAKATDNRVKFRFYPGGVMGSDQAVLKKIRFGQLQGAAFSAGALAKHVPDSQVYNIPFKFDSYAEVDYVRTKMDEQIEQMFVDAGFMNFGLAEGGFAYLMSKKPIHGIEDLKKNKVWIPTDDPASKAASDTFKFKSTTLSIGDVLTGLQTDMVDTIFASPIAAIALQWHTQINHLTELPLVYLYALMAIDKKHFDQLSAEDQHAVNRIMRHAFATIDQQNREDNKAAMQALKDQGVTIIQPTPEQVSQWNDAADQASDLFIKYAGISEEIRKELNRHLQEYRSKQGQ